jgi:pre-60S factor REI1
MIDKNHCKLAYETEKDHLEISDFYDFRSYPIASFKSSSRRTKKPGVSTSTAAGERSPNMGAAEDDENVTVQDGESIYDVESDNEEEIPEGALTYGDLPFKPVLPSGARIGYRSMRRYHKESFVAPPGPTHTGSHTRSRSSTPIY